MKFRHMLAGLALATPLVAFAQAVTTLAGGYGDGLPAAQARFEAVYKMALAVDGSGNVFAIERNARLIRRVDAVSGLMTTIAGQDYVAGFSGDGGPAIRAAIDPDHLAVDAQGNVFLMGRGRIRRIDAATGIITTVAGDGKSACTARSGEGGLAIATSICNGGGIAFDGAGNLYYAQSSPSLVRRVDKATGIVTTYAGDGSVTVSGNGGPATSAGLGSPVTIAFDAADNLYLDGGSTVRRIDRGTGQIGDFGGTPANDFAVDAAGNLFVATDAGIYRVDVVTRAATPVAGSTINTWSVRVDAQGRLYANAVFPIVVRIENGTATTIAGHAATLPNGDGFPGPASKLMEATDVVLDRQGNVLISDAYEHHIRRVSAATGLIESIAGSFTAGTTPDGTVAQGAFVNRPTGMAVDAANNIYFIEGGTRIRRISASDGRLSTFAGTGVAADSGDGGPALQAGFVNAAVLLFDAAGNLLVSDFGAGRVRRIDAATGIITTIAGSGVSGFEGDGGPATLAKLSGPLGLAFDASNNLHIADSANSRIRRVDAATGTITTVAGNTSGFLEDGHPALQTNLLQPWGVAFDPFGNLLVSENAFVRRISASDGLVRTIAGGGGSTSEGDDARAFRLTTPSALALSGSGELLVADRMLALFNTPAFNGPRQARVRRFAISPLDVSTVLHAFPGRLPQTTSVPLTSRITNSGNSAVALAPVVTGGGFAMTHDCPATLAPAAFCTVSVTFTPTSAIAHSGTVSINAGAPKITLVGSGELSLVTFYYESVLRRAPDSPGKDFWDGERSRMLGLGANPNETWFALSSFFFRSGEYLAFNRNDAGFVTDLYKTFFNRAPDAPGSQFWVDQLANGMPREVVLASFQHSTEFRDFTTGLFGNAPARGEVDMVMDMYRGLLGRLPDNFGFLNYRSILRGAQCQADAATAVANAVATMTEQFATQSEYTSKNRTNAQYVGDLYNAFLRRGGDLIGVLTWIQGLDAGTLTRAQVRDNFRASPEFTARVNAVTQQGCLP